MDLSQAFGHRVRPGRYAIANQPLDQEQWLQGPKSTQDAVPKWPESPKLRGSRMRPAARPSPHPTTLPRPGAGGRRICRGAGLGGARRARLDV